MTDGTQPLAVAQPARSNDVRAASTATFTIPRVVRMSPTLIRIIDGETTVGFVEKVCSVYVALVGERYAKAEEVLQSRELEPAAQRVVAEVIGR